MHAFREERSRCKRFVYGDQWGDWIDSDLGYMKEETYLRRQGHFPLKNNILRRILRNVVGLYRSQYKTPLLSAKNSGLDKKGLRDANRRRQMWFKENSMEELAPRLLEEFLISGIVAVKVDDGVILPVTPDNFFFHSDGYDPRGLDIDLIGEVHEVSFRSLLEKFCETAADYRRIASVYGSSRHESGGCRLTEVWHKEVAVYRVLHDEETGSISVTPAESPDDGLKDSDNVKTLVKTGWRRAWYADDGTLLRESGLMESQPYVFKAYPYLDGEVHSYISDLLDQQKFVNRLITLYDLIMRSSAKGVLLFPDESIPNGMDLQDVATEWSQFNGVIPYKAKPGVPMPTQVSANSTNIGITELLKIEMQMLEDISGVSPTLQGKLTATTTSGTLFAQQNDAAQTSLLDILRTFNDFLDRLAAKA